MISRRHLETLTAVVTGAFGAAVVVSSLDNGIGWSSAGVDAGTFPFMTGLVILAGSLFNLLSGALGSAEAVLGRAEMTRLARLFVPAAIYVGAIPLVGMYLASAVYVWGAVSLQRAWPHWRAAGFAVLFCAALYLVFERSFQIALPVGLLGTALGW